MNGIVTHARLSAIEQFIMDKFPGSEAELRRLFLKQIEETKAEMEASADVEATDATES